jgi:transcriptional regulator with XRE-family HTH domain
VRKAPDVVRQVTAKLAELRREQGLTQQALAEVLEVPVQHVSRIEAGQNITLATLERYATALGFNVHVLFEAAPGGPKKPPPSSRQRAKAGQRSS